MLCAAKLCGIREFANSHVKVVTLTGCTSMPGTKDKFCFKHRSEETPVRTGKDVSSETREKLKKHRKDLSASEKAQNDNIYIIESILQIRGSKWLVKWSGFDENAATWEPSQNVPKFVQAYYKKDPTRLGRKIPNPVIKHSKKVGNTKYHFLSWEGEKGGEWLNEDFFDILDDDGGQKQRQSKKAATPEKAEISGLVLTQLACLWESSLVELFAFSTICRDVNPYPRSHLENKYIFLTIQAKKAS